MSATPKTVEDLAGVPDGTVLPDGETVVGEYESLQDVNDDGSPKVDDNGDPIYVLDDNGDPVQTAVGWHKENN